MSTLSQTRLSLDRRIEWVLATYLPDVLGPLNLRIPSDQQIPLPKTVHVGVDSVVLERDRNPIDVYPAVCVYEQASRSTPAGFEGANDDVITFGVSALVVDDTANVAWCSQKAKLLALVVAETLETRLPEAPGLASPTGSVYRVDVASTNGPRSGPLRNTDLYLASYVVQITVYVRTKYGYNPAVFDVTKDPRPTTSTVFEPAPLIGLRLKDGSDTPVGNLDLTSPVKLSTTTGGSAILEVTLGLLADGTPITGWPTGTIAYFTRVEVGPTTPLGSAGSPPILALPPLVSGSEYTLTLIHATFGTLGVYRFTVTELP